MAPGGEVPRASAVVVTRDLPPTLPAALASLANQSLGAGLEIVLVINRPEGDVGPGLPPLDPAVRVVWAGENRGFAGGMNLGIAAARAPFVLALNDDAVAEPGWAEALVEAAAADPGVGMCASKVFFVDPPDRLDTAGHLLFADGLNRGRGRFEVDRGQFDDRPEVLFPSGAAALYRREMLDRIGAFDERFFAYGEDAELGLRARLAGWRCRYVPGAVARHHGSLTAGAHSAEKAYLVERNRVWVAAKHFPLPLLLLNPAIAAARYACQLAVALRGGPGLAARFREDLGLRAMVRVALRSQLHALAGLPAMLAERRRLARAGLRRLPPGTIYEWLRTDGIGPLALARQD